MKESKINSLALEIQKDLDKLLGLYPDQKVQAKPAWSKPRTAEEMTDEELDRIIRSGFGRNKAKKGSKQKPSGLAPDSDGGFPAVAASSDTMPPPLRSLPPPPPTHVKKDLQGVHLIGVDRFGDVQHPFGVQMPLGFFRCPKAIRLIQRSPNHRARLYHESLVEEIAPPVGEEIEDLIALFIPFGEEGEIGEPECLTTESTHPYSWLTLDIDLYKPAIKERQWKFPPRIDPIAFFIGKESFNGECGMRGFVEQKNPAEPRDGNRCKSQGHVSFQYIKIPACILKDNMATM